MFFFKVKKAKIRYQYETFPNLMETYSPYDTKQNRIIEQKIFIPRKKKKLKIKSLKNGPIWASSRELTKVEICLECA